MTIITAGIQAPTACRPNKPTGSDQLDLALATFLLKILMPGSAVRGRPWPAAGTGAPQPGRRQ